MVDDVLDLQRLPQMESIGLTEFWATLTPDDGCSVSTRGCTVTVN